MSPEQWQKIKAVFKEAQARTQAEREIFLDEVCNGDEEMRREVEALLSSYKDAESFLETPVVEKLENDIPTENCRLTEGQNFNHYEIIGQIGAGGMGEVYLAKDKKLDRKVAVKILNEKFARHESNLQRFIREAKAASALNHPNILTIYEIGECDNTHFIVSEYVEGKTLRQTLREKTLSQTEVLDVAVQTAGALTTAHEAGIVHRDIKPENIIVRKDGLVKVLDFGLAKLIVNKPNGVDNTTVRQNETTEGIILGTVNYMSPEQAKGEKVDARTDIFSFGILVYEMLTGRTPFAGDSVSETFANLFYKEPEPLSNHKTNVPDELRRIVSKTLRKDKDARYQTMKGLLADLKDLRENLSSAEKPERSALPPDDNATAVLQATTGDAKQQTAATHRSFTEKTKQHKAATLAVFVTSVIALAVIGYFTFFARQSPIASAPKIKSVIVLPLKNVGGDAQDEYLSDGITDELITKLTKLKTVRVVSPSVAMRYKNSPKDAAEIGREMNVEAVIEGTVRKVGTRFRLSIHLVSAQDGFEIWSDNDFESELNNLLDAERQIAEAVASRLKGQLTPQERNLVASGNTTNADAYELFLRGKQQYRQLEFQFARDLFDRALQLDPNFADAYAWRGLAIYGQFSDGSGDRASLDAALSDANRALQIDQNHIGARRTLIYIYHSTGQYEEGLKQGKQALEINSDDLDAIEGAALAYFRVGMMNKAIQLYQRAVAADPTSAAHRGQLARSYLHTGEYQKGLDVLSPVLETREGLWMAMHNHRALKQFDKAIESGRLLSEKYPDFDVGWLDFGISLKQAGRAEQARAVWAEGAKHIEQKLAAFENVRARIWLGLIYAELGEREKALAQANRALALEPNDAWTLFHVGMIHALLNNRREAVGYVKQSIAHGWLGIHYLDYFSDPNGAGFCDNLRDDAEFQQVRADLQKKVDELAQKY